MAKRVMLAVAGAGKTYLACALGAEACRKGIRTYYIRMHDLLSLVLIMIESP